MPAVWAEEKALPEDAPLKGTEFVNKHPVITMFLHQMMFLAGHEPVGADYYFECDKICRENGRRRRSRYLHEYESNRPCNSDGEY
jgi:hypothetical protein